MRNRSRYILPFVVAWIVLPLGGFSILFEDSSSFSAVVIAILLTAAVLSLLLTSILFAILEHRKPG